MRHAKAVQLTALFLSLVFSSSACHKVEVDLPKFALNTGASQTAPDPLSLVADERRTREAEVMSESDQATKEMLEAYFGPLPSIAEKVEYQHFKAKGLYISTGENLQKVIDICRQTEVNAVVLDIKENYGFTYRTNIPLALETEAATLNIDIGRIIQMLKHEGIHVIGRIVCFNDSNLANKRPDLCLTGQNGKPLIWPLEGNKAFTSPYNTEVWDYLVDVAEEAISMGVDEIQLDYVRFPSGDSLNGEDIYVKTPKNWTSDRVPTRAQAINRFIEYMRAAITDRLGIPIGLDCFGTVMVFPSDGTTIGQDWTSLGLTGLDNISPMVYPSHFSDERANGIGTIIGNYTFRLPDAEPQKLVLAALNAGNALLTPQQSNIYAHVRPFLQAFTASYLGEGRYIPYGREEVRAQIQAVYEAGYDEWFLWNSDADYEASWFNSKNNPGQAVDRTPVIEKQVQKATEPPLIQPGRSIPTGINHDPEETRRDESLNTTNVEVEEAPANWDIPDENNDEENWSDN